MKLSLIASIAALGMAFSCSQADNSTATDKTTYEVVFRENLSGVYEKSQTGANSFSYHYTYADRGRGPVFDEEITLNEQNFITAQTITGVNYRKASVEESFSSNESTATWNNLLGESSGDFTGDKLYFRFDGSPAIYEILAQLLLKSPTGEVGFYPQGGAELTKKLPLELSDGTSVDLLIINGLDLDPTYLWMIGDQFVAMISGNLHIVREDLSDKRLEMQKMQGAVEDEGLLEISKNLSHSVDKVLIQNVNIFLPTGNTIAKQDVYVVDNKISSISPAGTNAPVAEAQVIDGSGKTLMPGMFDMHTHNSKFRGLLYLAGGVTSVRDLANNKQIKDLAAQFDKSEIIGPRIVYYAGIIDGPGEFANQRNVVENLDEALAEIQDYKDLGYEQIKLYSSIQPDWVLPLTEKAHELGMKVSGHIPAYMTATQAINQGYDEIQHINMLFLNFLSDTIDTRTPLRHVMPAEHGLNLDLNSKEYLDFVKLLKSKDIIVDATMAIFENMYTAQKGVPSPTYEMVLDRFPLMNQRSFYAGGLEKDAEQEIRYQDSFTNMLAVVLDLYEKGVRIVPGTDGLPGFLYHRELELYVKAGIPAAEVLQLATIKSAEIAGVADELGSIEVGKQADLVLIDGNPTKDITDIRKIEWTMKGGKLYYGEELYKAVGVKHFK